MLVISRLRILERLVESFEAMVTSERLTQKFWGSIWSSSRQRTADLLARHNLNSAKDWHSILITFRDWYYQFDKIPAIRRLVEQISWPNKPSRWCYRQITSAPPNPLSSKQSISIRGSNGRMTGQTQSLSFSCRDMCLDIIQWIIYKWPLSNGIIVGDRISAVMT